MLGKSIMEKNGSSLRLFGWKKTTKINNKIKKYKLTTLKKKKKTSAHQRYHKQKTANHKQEKDILFTVHS